MESLGTAIESIAKENLGRKSWDTPLDYFSWGRDERHRVDDTESLPADPTAEGRTPLRRRIRSIMKGVRPSRVVHKTLRRFEETYAGFEETYRLMSDQPSRQLFAELVYMKLRSEEQARLSSFTRAFIDAYEVASARVLAARETLSVYTWKLGRIDLDRPWVSFFTSPAILNLHLNDRLYRYENAGARIEVEPGDVVIDAGVGWGDTCIYLAARAGEAPGGHLYAFDILEEGLAALAQQLEINPHIENLTPVLKGLSDKDGDHVWISAPGPGARITDEDTGRQVETITIDTFCAQQDLDEVDFIKMDIEGAEVPALSGAARTIRKHKPKLAISAYHKWDDLLQIPRLIHALRDDYRFHLDCTTGFGGEVVLYCD